MLGPLLVNGIRERLIAQGVAPADAYTPTMYLMACLLLVALVADLLVKPVAARHYLPESEDEAAGPAAASQPSEPSLRRRRTHCSGPPSLGQTPAGRPRERAMAIVTYTTRHGFGVTYDDAWLTHVDDPDDPRLAAAWQAHVPAPVAGERPLRAARRATAADVAAGRVPSQLITTDDRRCRRAPSPPGTGTRRPGACPRRSSSGPA